MCFQELILSEGLLERTERESATWEAQGFDQKMDRKGHYYF